MSTNDVPGFNASNRDTLSMGCWAETADGSLLFVEGSENGRVIYTMFDASHTPILEYRDAMPEKDFMAAFSWQADRKKVKDAKAKAVPKDIKWTWHDKTAFPWDRVISKGAKDGVRYASAADQLDAAAKVAASIAASTAPADDKPSDAQRVAESLQLMGERVKEREDHRERTLHRVGGMLRRIADKLDGLGKDA